MTKEKEAANLGVSQIGRIRPGTLELVFQRDIKIDSIHKAVDAAMKWHGCLACGMNGLDLRFRPQEVYFEAFSHIEGLRDINVYR